MNTRMRRRLREPFGKAGLTVAVLALVLAMVGGAYAAGGLTKSQEKQVTKIAKKFAGKPGATGAAGLAGATGATGKNGTNGAPGTNGTNGKDGSPWTAGGTLPKGSTETGVWATPETSLAEGQQVRLPISFPLPLAAPLEDEVAPGEVACEEPEATRTLKCQVHFILANGEEVLAGNAQGEHEQTVCPGTVSEPKAKPGNLCVYTSTFFLNVQFSLLGKPSQAGSQGGADRAGSILSLIGDPHEEPRFVAGGTWAVTAE